MGVRLYDPTTGRFLQTDPIPGGSANAYDYAGQDPINQFDLDGRSATQEVGTADTTSADDWLAFDRAHTRKRPKHHHWWQHWRGIAEVAVLGGCIVVTGGLCTAAGAVLAVVSNVHHNGKRWSFDAKGAALDLAWTAIGGRAGKALLGDGSAIIRFGEHQRGAARHALRQSIDWGASGWRMGADVFVNGSSYGGSKFSHRYD